jgi:Protein of unknown function (DUF4256)
MEELAVSRTLLGRKRTSEFIFYDCSAESPKRRRSLCYDREALESREENKPENSAIELAAAMGIELLTEEQYRELQKLGEFDAKTSSWVKIPSAIRKLGGALFCDRRFDTVFVYHNGAESYYAARGGAAGLGSKLENVASSGCPKFFTGPRFPIRMKLPSLARYAERS